MLYKIVLTRADHVCSIMLRVCQQVGDARSVDCSPAARSRPAEFPLWMSERPQLSTEVCAVSCGLQGSIFPGAGIGHHDERRRHSTPIKLQPKPGVRSLCVRKAGTPSTGSGTRHHPHQRSPTRSLLECHDAYARSASSPQTQTAAPQAPGAVTWFVRFKALRRCPASCPRWA